MPDSDEYKAFRTGLTFQDVFQMVWSHSDDPKDWPKGKAGGRRHTVLGKWREIKLEMWDRYKNQTGEEDVETF